MGMMIPQQQSAISDELKTAFAEATPFEIRLATAYMYHPTKQKALIAIGADPSLEHDAELWNKVMVINREISRNLVISAMGMMEKYIPQAMQVLVNGLQSPNEKIRLQTARYLIERAMGKPSTHAKVDISANTSHVQYHIHGIDPDRDWDDENTVEGLVYGDADN